MQKWVLYILIVAGFISACQNKKESIPCIQNFKLPKNYTVYYVQESMKMDGKATEHAWQKAPWTQDFVDIANQIKPKYRTHLKMLWNDTHLYFYAELEDPHIWATLKQKDTVIFYNNDFEIFIKPDDDTQNYYEFEVNAHNTLWDLFLPKPYRDGGKALTNWDCRGIQTAVQIEGTLNQPKDKDTYWSVEMALPWRAIYETFDGNSKAPKNKIWRMNFSRVHWDFDLTNHRYSRKKIKNQYLPEQNWVWSPQEVVAMHEPEKWGFVKFSTHLVGENESHLFKYPANTKLQLQMYAWHRQMLAHFKQNQKWNTQILPTKFRYFQNKITLNKQHSPAGYVLWFVHPLTKQIWSITQNGQLKIIKTNF